MSRSGMEEERERYRELLEELRTIIPGVQVLLAFLLTVHFAARIMEIDLLSKVVFTGSLVAVAAATLLFLAPPAYHRLARHHDRLGRLRVGVRSDLLGLFLLALAISCAVSVVTRFIFDGYVFGAVAASAVAILTLATWYVLPICRRPGSEQH